MACCGESPRVFVKNYKTGNVYLDNKTAYAIGPSDSGYLRSILQPTNYSILGSYGRRKGYVI